MCLENGTEEEVEARRLYTVLYVVAFNWFSSWGEGLASFK